METKLKLTIKEGDRLASIREFLSSLLSQKRIESLLVLMQQERGKTAMALVSSPDMLKSANPLAPVMTRNELRPQPTQGL